MGLKKTDELRNRLKNFGFNVIKLIRSLPKTEENRFLSRQILRSATSIGANYAEAVFGQTRQEFLHCLNICRKEANETLYWLEMLSYANPIFKDEINELLDENTQILKIFISSVKTIQVKNSK